MSNQILCSSLYGITRLQHLSSRDIQEETDNHQTWAP